MGRLAWNRIFKEVEHDKPDGRFKTLDEDEGDLHEYLIWCDEMEEYYWYTTESMMSEEPRNHFSVFRLTGSNVHFKHHPGTKFNFIDGPDATTIIDNLIKIRLAYEAEKLLLE